MPPKRGASAMSAASDAAPAKKAKSKGGRWSAVSASANADEDYKFAMKKKTAPYGYECRCSFKFLLSSDDDEDDEWDDTDDEDSEEADDVQEVAGQAPAESTKKRVKCDAGKTCVCYKPIEDHPDHPWFVTRAGWRKFATQTIHVSLRDPDTFGMYTYNDHAGLGVMEVVQNLFLDFIEAQDSWQEQWAICEATAMFLLSDHATPLFGIDDPSGVYETTKLVGRMFLSMLARLDQNDLLRKDGEVRNIGLVMGMYVLLAARLRDIPALPEGEKPQNEGSLIFNTAQFDDHVAAYAQEHDIDLRGGPSVAQSAAECDATANLPSSKDAKDPWAWDKGFKAYGISRGGRAHLGGDSLDVTTWTSARRKEHSFNGKDPLGKKEIEAIKNGLVMQLA